MSMIKTRSVSQKTGYVVLAAAVLALVFWFVLYTPVARWLIQE